jgi:exopolysaccharide biosynthesis protein
MAGKGSSIDDLPELAAYLLNRDAKAMNLDGGGSAEVWVNGQIANSPVSRERKHSECAGGGAKDKNPIVDPRAVKSN